MWFRKFSIKALTISNLLLIGFGVVILSVVAGITYKNAAQEDETRILQRIIKVSVKEVLETLHDQSIELGATTENERNFRKAIKDLEQPENRETVITRLNDQFQQRYVTAGIVDLKKIRVFNTNFKLIASSTNGTQNLPQELPDFLYEQAKVREGGERLKALGGIWIHDDETYYSVIVPVGGLHLRGYLEVVTNPAFKLRRIESMLTAPLRISSHKGDELYVSKNWNAEEQNVLTVEYFLPTAKEENSLKIEMLENIETFSNKFRNTELVSLASFVVIIAIGIGFSLYVFSKFVFKPLHNLMQSMESCAEGDLTVEVKSEGLKDLTVLGDSLGRLVKSLHTQVSELQGNIGHVSNAAGELSIVTSETNQAIQQQQQDTSQVATAINEMSATVQEVATHAEEAAAAAQSADVATSEGKKVVEDTIKQIHILAEEIERATSVIENLKAESENIGSVMDVIRGIAEQTNLLALNAAIEAARAGEQGRGFAVVADEVRVLASRTQESTQEIESMIEKIQSGASDAMRAMQESKQRTTDTVNQAAIAGESLETITRAVANINEMNTQIASAAEEQSAVAEEINKSIESISEVAQITSKGAIQTASSSDSLADLSDTLQNLVARFKI